MSKSTKSINIIAFITFVGWHVIRASSIHLILNRQITLWHLVSNEMVRGGCKSPQRNFISPNIPSVNFHSMFLSYYWTYLRMSYHNDLLDLCVNIYSILMLVFLHRPGPFLWSLFHSFHNRHRHKDTTLIRTEKKTKRNKGFKRNYSGTINTLKRGELRNHCVNVFQTYFHFWRVTDKALDSPLKQSLEIGRENWLTDKVDTTFIRYHLSLDDLWVGIISDRYVCIVTATLCDTECLSLHLLFYEKQQKKLLSYRNHTINFWALIPINTRLKGRKSGYFRLSQTKKWRNTTLIC